LAGWSDPASEEEDGMTAYTIVRFKVKAGQEPAFLDFHRNATCLVGMLSGDIVKTGERAYCLVARWDTFESIAAARPQMIGMLDQFRHMLEDLGSGLGVTDPVSGTTIVELKPA
jgi:hypothetical protein